MPRPDNNKSDRADEIISMLEGLSYEELERVKSEAQALCDEKKEDKIEDEEASDEHMGDMPSERDRMMNQEFTDEEMP